MMPELALPEVFLRNIRESYPGRGAIWLEGLPERIRMYEERWEVRAGEPFPLSYSYCAPAVMADGREAVLKLGVPCVDFTQQVKALRYFDGHGMVRMLRGNARGGAMLLERLRPGKTLAEEVSDDDEATRIIARVLPAMWVPVASNPGFKTFADWGRNFGRIRKKFAGRECPLSWRVVDWTEGILADLLSSSGEQVLLHGDLHHENVLSVEGDALGWRAIDPFGIVGEREIDVGAMLRNPYLQPPVDTAMQKKMARRLDIFREMLGFDLQRMRAWAGVYCAVSAWWTLSVDSDGWQLDAELAKYFVDSL